MVKLLDRVPTLHWGLVVVLASFTGGIFFYFWALVQGWYLHIQAAGSKALQFYATSIALTLGAFLPLGSTGWVTWVLSYSGIFFLFFGHFQAKWGIEEMYRSSGQPQRLSSFMTFFFGVIYSQHHLYRLNHVEPPYIQELEISEKE